MTAVINTPIIITDYKHLLLDIERQFSKSRHNLVYKIRIIMTAYDIDISPCWILSHIGLLDHDQTDNLAKRAANFDNISIPILWEFQETYSIIND